MLVFLSFPHILVISYEVSYWVLRVLTAVIPRHLSSFVVILDPQDVTPDLKNVTFPCFLCFQVVDSQKWPLTDII